MADETLPLPLAPRPQGKRCKRCRKIKPLSEFHYRPEALRHRAECKDCYRAAMTARRDPEDNRRRVKEWQKANPEKRRAQSRRSYENSRTDLIRWVANTLKYLRAACKNRKTPIDCDLTPDMIGWLFERQHGKCTL